MKRGTGAVDNVERIVRGGTCTGCGACGICEHISFAKNRCGFYSPVVDGQCTGCGRCVAACLYDPQRENGDSPRASGPGALLNEG